LLSESNNLQGTFNPELIFAEEFIDMKTPSSPIRRALLAASVAGLVAVPVGAATIDVTTTADDVIADDGKCSLREAVISANTNPLVAPAAGECANGEAVPTIDVINIPAGTYSLTFDPVDSSLVENGPGDYSYGEYSIVWQVDEFVVTVTPNAANGDLDITERMTPTWTRMPLLQPATMIGFSMSSMFQMTSMCKFQA
jgi:CSLREA domain-containing protein